MIRRRARRKWKSTPFALIVGETGAPNTQLRQYAATKARWGETRGKLKMSETNGGNDLTFSERLRALEASHVELMTDRELFIKTQDKAWRRHRRFVREQDARWKRYDARCENDRLDRVALFERID
jgi:hypothetical protein